MPLAGLFMEHFAFEHRPDGIATGNLNKSGYPILVYISWTTALFLTNA
jgi:hypothetical protein